MDESNPRSEVVVAGFGSPHGDDQAGWRVVLKLAERAQNAANYVPIREGTQLLGEIENCRKLVVVDACCTDSKLGTITRFRWPDPRIPQRHNHSTHGIGLCNALELVEKLGRVPEVVEVFGIEISSLDPGGELSYEVDQAVDLLVEVIAGELREVVHA